MGWDGSECKMNVDYLRQNIPHEVLIIRNPMAKIQKYRNIYVQTNLYNVVIHYLYVLSTRTYSKIHLLLYIFIYNVSNLHYFNGT